MNIETIKSETESYFKSEGKEEFFKEKVHNTKSDILSDFKKWNQKNPDKKFTDFKAESIEEIKAGMQFLSEILYVGIFLTALDEVVV